MSAAARQSLVGRLVFQDDVAREDLLNASRTQTELVALLLGLTDAGYHVEVTAVRGDHHDDSALGLHCHANGYCADVWPLASTTPGDYLDAGDPRFARFIGAAARSPWCYSIGLAGSAYTPTNMAQAGASGFEDSGADHVHLAAI